MEVDRSADEIMDDVLAAEAAAEAADAIAPILQAAEDGDAATMCSLLDEKKLPIDTKGEDGDCALSIGCLYGRVAVVQECLRRGACVTACDEDNSTPLHDAAAGGHYDIVVLLLDSGAQVDAIDNDGDSPLHNACNGGHAHIASLLMARLGGERSSALLKAANANGQTPLDLAEDPALVAQLRIGSGADGDGEGDVGSSFKRTKS
jgi:ankyrin repeat protein